MGDFRRIGIAIECSAFILAEERACHHEPERDEEYLEQRKDGDEFWGDLHCCMLYRLGLSRLELIVAILRIAHE